MVTTTESRTTRSNERAALWYPVMLTTGRETGEGQVWDLSGTGGSIESHVGVTVGQMLQLRIIIPEADRSLQGGGRLSAG
jgi:hypothetical protein